MTSVWVTLITVLGGIVSTLIGFLIKNYRQRKELKRRNDQYKELCNYAFGQIDMIIQDEIKVTPDIRAAMKRASKRYHRLDLVKDCIKEEKSKEDKEKDSED